VPFSIPYRRNRRGRNSHLIYPDKERIEGEEKPRRALNHYVYLAEAYLCLQKLSVHTVIDRISGRVVEHLLDYVMVPGPASPHCRRTPRG